MRRILSTLILCAACVAGFAQTGNSSFDDFLKNARSGFSSFRDSTKTEFNAFRKKVNSEYAKFLSEGDWVKENEMPKPKPLVEVVPKPKPPVVMPEEEVDEPIEDVEIEIEEELAPIPEPEPQPEPIAPIEEIPEPEPLPIEPEIDVVTPPAPVVPTHEFSFYGTAMKVRISDKQKFRISNAGDPKAIGAAWEKLSGDEYSNMIFDCLKLRKEYALCDWAYLNMIDSLSCSFNGKGTNEATFMTAYIFCQSGYRMRFGMEGNKLHLLVATPHSVYGKGMYNLDNQKYFVLTGDPRTLSICNSKFEGEKTLSLYIPQLPKLAAQASAERTIKSMRYPEIQVTSVVNKNLMNFYDSYPTSVVGENVCTRWAMYAETPLSSEAEQSVVSQLRGMIEGLDEAKALNKILNFVQTGFKYDYDENIWGQDRAFFGDETLFYPFCDCEDRSIFFSRLVRELLGLKVMLVYYPGHLATAVCTKEEVKGDHIMLKGEKFIVCDPTYENAPIGLTMPGMDNAGAKVIVLNKVK